MNDRSFTATAVSLGERLVDQAHREGRSWSWAVRVPSRNDGRRDAETRPAGPDLYQGTAGIALFLGELAGVTGDDRFAEAAHGAWIHALEAGSELPETAFGFHEGRVGLAWVAARLADVLDAPELGREVGKLVKPLAGNEARDGGLDVIAGAAGAVPALLDLARRRDRDDWIEIARRLGEHLIRKAWKSPGGWSWNTLPRSSARGLTGFAHGTAGIAVALLELARVTGDGRFRFAAEMALLYERRAFDPERGNWPDYRHTLLGDLLRAGRVDEIRDAAREGRFPPYRTRFMSAWCHGAPGSGLARLRAWELTGEDRLLDELRRAVETTRASVDPEPEAVGNFSLCHGAAGNAELLVEAGRRLDEPDWVDAARRVAATGRTRHEAGAWPCGTVDGGSDPSLLLGEAGIGLFFLRLDDPSIPTVLLVRPADDDAPGAGAAETPALGFREAWRESAEEAFRTTYGALEALSGVEPPELPVPAGAGALEESPPEVAGRVLERHLGTETDGSRRAVLEDAFRLDLSRHALVGAETDRTAETVRRLSRPPAAEAPWEAGRFRRAPGVRRLDLAWDWTDPPASGVPEAGPVPAMLLRGEGVVKVRKVSPFAAVVLDALESPARVEDVVDSVVRALGDAGGDGGEDGVDRGLLLERVSGQMCALYEAGFVDAVPKPPEEEEEVP